MTLMQLHLLFLIIVANGSPIIANCLFGSRFKYPVDMGVKLENGQGIFGASKTWRGLLSSLLITAVISDLLGYGLWVGACIAMGAMAGDLLSSFCKRRLNRSVSSQALWLDQIPECLLPILAVYETFSMDWASTVSLVLCFIFIELTLSVLLFKLHIRDRPY